MPLVLRTTVQKFSLLISKKKKKITDLILIGAWVRLEAPSIVW